MGEAIRCSERKPPTAAGDVPGDAGVAFSPHLDCERAMPRPACGQLSRRDLDAKGPSTPP